MHSAETDCKNIGMGQGLVGNGVIQSLIVLRILDSVGDGGYREGVVMEIEPTQRAQPARMYWRQR